MAYSSDVYQAKDLTVIYDATGGAGTAKIYTDMPASRLTTQGNANINLQGLGLNDQIGNNQPSASANLPVTVGRGTVTLVLDAIGASGNYTEGTLYMLEAIPATNGILRLFGATIRVRKIGVYLQPGQTFRTNPISFGAGAAGG